MSYRLRRAEPEDRERYDAFVASVGGHACQSFDWCEAERTRGWQPLRLLLESGSGTLVAAAAVIRKPVFRRYSILDVPWGPVFAPGDEEAGIHVLQALKQLARQTRAIILRVNPYLDADPSLRETLQAEQFVSADPPWRYQTTRRIDLRSDLQTIFSGFRAQTRTRIRKAEKLGLEISDANSPEDFQAFADLYRDTQRRRGLTPRGQQELHAVWSLAGLSQLFVVRLQGRPVRALLDYSFGYRVWQVMSGSPGNVVPGQCANWAAITWAKARGYTEYDLGGIPSDLEKSPGQRGIYEYKRGFGGTVVELLGEFEWSPGRAYQWGFRRLLNARRWLRRGRPTEAPDTLTEGEHVAGMGG